MARESIRDLVARYNQCGDSGRIDDLVGLFVKDAVLEVSGGAVHQGQEAIRSFLSDVAPADTQGLSISLIRHHVATHRSIIWTRCMPVADVTSAFIPSTDWITGASTPTDIPLTVSAGASSPDW